MAPIVTFRGLFPSEPAVRQAGREWNRLSRQFGGLGGCHVVVEVPQRGQEHGRLYQCSVRVIGAGFGAQLGDPGMARHGELGRAVKQAFANARAVLLRDGGDWTLPPQTKLASAQ